MFLILVLLHIAVQVRLCMLNCLQYGVPQTRHVSGWELGALPSISGSRAGYLGILWASLPWCRFNTMRQKTLHKSAILTYKVRAPRVHVFA